MNTYEIEKQQIKNAIAAFPSTFGLKGFPGDRFRISERASYFSDKTMYLYTQVDRNGEWLDFAKATYSELRYEMTSLPKEVR